MNFVEPSVFLHESIGSFAEGIDVLLDVGWFVPSEFSSRLDFCIDVANALLKVLQFFEDHAFLRIDNFFRHVVVEVSYFL